MTRIAAPTEAYAAKAPTAFVSCAVAPAAPTAAPLTFAADALKDAAPVAAGLASIPSRSDLVVTIPAGSPFAPVALPASELLI